ncbi:MAG: hypothetical protein M9941_06510 [Anaerolineae bacterium]|nr:hypothetical protein [Anaerolineae bacterium]
MSNHLTDDQISDYVAATTTSDERVAIQQHLTFCADCRTRVETARSNKIAPKKPASTASVTPDKKSPPRTVLIIGLGIVFILAVAAFFVLRQDDNNTVAAPQVENGAPQPIGLTEGDRPWLNAPGWGRARLVAAASTTDAVSIAVDDNGDSYLLIFVRIGEEQFPYVVALNRSAEIIWTQIVDVPPLIVPDLPQIVWNGSQLDLFWISDEQLVTAQMNTDGTLSKEPRVLSGDRIVGSFDVVSGPDNTVTLWYSGTRRDPGLYAFLPGDLSAEPTLIDPEGFRPSIRYDADGVLHVSWLNYPLGFETTTYYYAAYPQGVAMPGSESAVRTRSLGTNKRLQGPILGVDADNVYLFWSEETTSGPSAGDIDTEYLTFPLGRPELVGSPAQIQVPATYDLAYDDPGTDGVSAGSRVSLQPLTYPGTSRLSSIATNVFPQSELVIGYRTDLPYLWRNTQMQVGTAFLTAGVPVGHQLVTFSSAFSTSPFVTSEDRFLAMTWLEQNDESAWNVYYATTRPETRQAIRALSGSDIAGMATDSIFGLLSGMVLAPIAVGIWMIVPALLLFGMMRFVRGDDNNEFTIGMILVIIVFVVLYKVIQIGSLPTTDITPFAAWIPILTPTFGRILQLFMPFIIAAIALAVSYYLTYGRGRQSLLYFMLLYAALDGVMMMAVYGSWFFGAL